MSEIKAIYSQEPNFPATDQHPAAVRYQVGGRWVDAVGGEPTQAEIDAVLNFKPQPDRAAAMISRQREVAIEDLDVVINTLPPSTKAAFNLVRQLLEKE